MKMSVPGVVDRPAADVSDDREVAVALNAVDAVLIVGVAERPSPVHRRSHHYQGNEHVRGPADEHDINRSTDVGGEGLRWQPRGIGGDSTTTAIDPQHAASASVRDVQRTVGADRASGRELPSPKLAS